MSELIYGRRAVYETLRAHRRHIFRLWVEGEGEPKGGGLEPILEQAAALKVPVRAVKGGVFTRLAQENVNAQGVALEVGDYPYVQVDEILRHARKQEEPPFLLILDHLQDPQNLGTLIRTAEAMGVHGILIPSRRSARVTPAVSNASAGAVEHMRLAQVVNINRLIDELKEANIWVAGLDSDDSTPLLDPATLDGALAVVVGSEGRGLSRLTREKCDFLVRLPMYGQVASLNAAVAGSIVLYLARQARTR
ncbi:23S rRNA (guanosine(2251)-2'-O)-methyltransferase RlmB [Litorilinea aerophila]|uniref:23S rRNA (Guanosine(2251)-2'-O)-methyltransferase RlmB n=1 Tax=Litorilinea aerophila TaxID=1204385 RepID=A0A540VB99_9CHLR|nr:23S rRNA (guanosine(2251)-2'-O)-methyltransferase RlmB [Litorilinea aerophila]MCC9078075.1 23S rRNA (guanosine(2251)-2'-O)-methyltransferase RlmB [Litorilinea aerophila]